MYEGYLSIDGVEVINAARTKTYIANHLPGVDVRCAIPDRALAALGADWTDPATDNAPWYDAGLTATSRFYGLFPGKVEGADDSTRKINVTELSGDGAVHSLPRFGSREIRFTVLAIAADGEALALGLAWLRDVLDTGCGPANGIGCLNREASLFTAVPDTDNPTDMLRTFYHVETLEGPTVNTTFGSKRAAAVAVEFTLSAGIPWAFTQPGDPISVSMDAGTTLQTDAAGEDCSEQNTAYANFINDPYFTSIAQPPRAPTITPPNLSPVSSWYRKTIPIPSVDMNHPGRVVPMLILDAGPADLKQVRLRFYQNSNGLTGCGYDGEFLLSYLPANATMTIDGIRREVWVALSNGAVVPGGHLLFGSDGNPFQWPTLSCHNASTLVIDRTPTTTGLTVSLTTYIRE